MAFITDWAYYENEGNSPEELNWGSYQYVSLSDIVNNFELMHTGNTSLVNNEPRYKVLFHAKQGIKKLNYNSMKEIKALELTVCEMLRFVFPQDYVNWVRISVYENGLLKPMQQNVQILHADAYLQDNDCKILFDEDGYVLKPEFSNFTLDRLEGRKKSIYLGGSQQFYGREGWNIDGEWAFEHNLSRQRFGQDGETANINPTFQIDRMNGVIHFPNGMQDKSVVLEYVSDGMKAGDNSKINVNKLFEDWMYSYIEYAILKSKFGVQEYIVKRKMREQSALLSNAEIATSGLHPAMLIQSIRGGDNWIK